MNPLAPLGGEMFPSLGGCPQGGGFVLLGLMYKWITYILLMYWDCNLSGTRCGTSERGGDYGWEIYDNCIFCVGTMCTSSQYLMEYCDSGMGFYCNGI